MAKRLAKNPNGGVDYRIPLSELQARIDAEMPLEGVRAGVAYTVTDVALSLGAGTASVRGRLVLHGWGREIEFDVSGTGQPNYWDGALYVANVTVERVDLVGARGDFGPLGIAARLAGALADGYLPDVLLDQAKALALSVASDAIAKQFKHPVHVLADGSFAGTLVSWALLDLRVDAGGATVTLDRPAAVSKAIAYAFAFCLLAAAAFAFWPPQPDPVSVPGQSTNSPTATSR